MTSQALVAQLRELGLWPSDAPSARPLVELSERITDGKLFARALLERDLLTPYQANQLLTGKGASLVVAKRYRILARLGEGAMGQVFKARHTSGAIVALKILRPDRVKNPITLSRFLREVHAAARLTHPNVVRALDAMQIDGFYCYALEYVEGVDLARLIKKEGPRPISQACAIIRQAALGLQHIHEHGLIHRDVKPGNLMIARADGAVKLLDLGLARLNEDPSQEGRGGLTQLGTVMGTPDFMAPEQARDPRAVDIRSDIYGLGCTLYYALTGQVPYAGGTAIEKMMKHQIEPPRPVTDLRPEVPLALVDVLSRMMAKEPSRRYQIPVEVADALAPFAIDAPPVVWTPLIGTDGASDPFELFANVSPPRRKRTFWWKLAVALVLAAGSAALILLALWLRSLAR